MYAYDERECPQCGRWSGGEFCSNDCENEAADKAAQQIRRYRVANGNGSPVDQRLVAAEGAGDEPALRPTTNNERLDAKAAQLATAYVGYGWFTVASGSEPGKTYTVQATHDRHSTAGWACDCQWAQHGGENCSHVRAAFRWLARDTARQERAARQAVAA